MGRNEWEIYGRYQHELGTREDHGTYESEAEVAACLAFAGLRPDQVEIRSNMPLLALTLTALPQECRR